MKSNPVFEKIEEDFSEHIKYFQKMVRQPSVSAKDDGVREMAELLVERIRGLGAECRAVETGGYPIVYGFLDAGAEKTILFYELYDVQPADAEGWIVPPFSGEIARVEDAGFREAVVSRGTCNSKGCVAGFLNVLDAFKQSGELFPVNVIFMIEGEEEIGSPNLSRFIYEHREELKKADCVYQPYFGENTAGKTILNLGFKGLLYLELICKGGSWGGPAVRDIHPLQSGWIASVPVRLIKALNTLFNEAGEIAIPDFGEDILPPSEEEMAMMTELSESFDSDTMLKEQGAECFRWKDIDKEELMRRNLQLPSINVDGLYSGYIEEGSKAIMPCWAIAKLDIRLVPGMKPEKCIEKIRRHLDKAGYGDIEIKVYNAYPAAQTLPSKPCVQALIKSVKECAEGDVEIWPRYAGAAPHYLFTEVLGLPTAVGGLGHGGRTHSTNEYVTLDGFKKHEKGIASFLLHFGEDQKSIG